MKHRKQTQHWRRYRSGRSTFVNRGIKYYNPVIGSTTHEQAQKLLFEGTKRQPKRYAYGKATGTYFGEVIKSELGVEGDYLSPTYFVRGPDGTVDFFNKKIILLGSCKAKDIAECRNKEWKALDKQWKKYI